jgi:hypothetical protein
MHTADQASELLTPGGCIQNVGDGELETFVPDDGSHTCADLHDPIVPRRSTGLGA